jgi:hypothetical protein
MLRALDGPHLTELLQAAALVAADTCTRAGADPPRRVLDQPDRTTAMKIGTPSQGEGP